MKTSLASRIVARFLHGSRKIPMGIGDDGLEHFWPEVAEYDIDPGRSDRFGAFYEVTYGHTSSGSYLTTGLFVDFSFRGDGPPGTYEAKFQRETRKGTWKDEHEISRILGDLAKRAAAKVEEIEKSLLHLGGSSWEVTYDGLDLSAEYLNGDPSNDAYISVTFQEVSDALKGEPQEALIHGAKGSDYEGSFGDKEVTRKYESLEDMERILKEAEKVYQSLLA